MWKEIVLMYVHSSGRLGGAKSAGIKRPKQGKGLVTGNPPTSSFFFIILYIQVHTYEPGSQIIGRSRVDQGPFFAQF